MTAKELGQQPAFPLLTFFESQGNVTPDYEIRGYPGLSKREQFAMAAMQGMLSNPDWSVNPLIPTAEKPTSIIELSVQAADALLVELAKEQK